MESNIRILYLSGNAVKRLIFVLRIQIKHDDYD